MEIVDLTLPIFSGCPTFPGQAQVVVFSWHDISLHEYRTNALFFMDHTGTHVDVPAHFLPEGKTVEEMGLDRFMGKTITIDLSPLVGKGVVDLPEFKNLFLPEKGTEEGAIVLLYTGMDALFGKREYFEKEIGISEEVAQFLVERKIKGVGIDAPSIDSHPFAAHRVLLSHQILIFEGLTNLKALMGKSATFFGLPLKLQGCSGSPIRAFALME